MICADVESDSSSSCLWGSIRAHKSMASFLTNQPSHNLSNPALTLPSLSFSLTGKPL